MSTPTRSILHVCSRDTIIHLRDQILRLKGYEVESTLSLAEALQSVEARKYSLVLIDVEGDGRVASAEKLCTDIKERRPDQEVVFVCNHRVSIHSECPNEIIRSEFNPQAMIDGVKAVFDGMK